MKIEIKKRTIARLNRPIKEADPSTPLFKKRRKREEETIQINCVKWFRYQYPNIIIHHSPNGGLRNKTEAINFKKSGTLPGFPDLFIAYPCKGFHGLFIEMKSEKGETTEKQNDVLSNLEKHGYFVAVCNSAELFIKIVKDYLKK